MTEPIHAVGAELDEAARALIRLQDTISDALFAPADGAAIPLTPAWIMALQDLDRVTQVVTGLAEYLTQLEDPGDGQCCHEALGRVALPSLRESLLTRAAQAA